MARNSKSKDAFPAPMLEPAPKLTGDFSPEAVQRRTVNIIKRVVAAGWGTKSVVEILAAIETSVIADSTPSWVTDAAAAAAIEADQQQPGTNGE